MKVDFVVIQSDKEINLTNQKETYFIAICIYLIKVNYCHEFDVCFVFVANV